MASPQRFTPEDGRRARRSLRLPIVALVVTTPFALALAFAGGCGNSKPAANPQPSVSTSSSSSAPPDAGTAIGDAVSMTPDAVQLVTDVGGDGNPWAAVMASADAATDAQAPPCWKGFTPTGNPEADVVELGHRCAAGMAQLFPPVKYHFNQGESKSIPVPIVPGCYRLIAVGGKGVKDVDLALKDNAGKVVAADMTPDDIFPMIHPNKEFCAEAVQFLNLVISVKKGSGDVAGGAWKR